MTEPKSLDAILAELEASIDPDPVGFVSSTLVNQQRAALAAALRESLASVAEIERRESARKTGLAHIAARMHDKVQDLGGVSAHGCQGAMARQVQHYQRYLVDILVNPITYVEDDLDPDEASPVARDWIAAIVRKYEMMCGWATEVPT